MSDSSSFVLAENNHFLLTVVLHKQFVKASYASSRNSHSGRVRGPRGFQKACPSSLQLYLYVEHFVVTSEVLVAKYGDVGTMFATEEMSQ
jgi:hypothetical protein